MAEINAIKDVPTVEVMRRALDLVGDQEFEQRARARIDEFSRGGKFKAPESMLVEAEARSIVALANRAAQAEKQNSNDGAAEVAQEQPPRARGARNLPKPQVVWNGKMGRGMARQALGEHIADLRKKYPDLEFTPVEAPEFGDNRWKLEGRPKVVSAPAPAPAVVKESLTVAPSAEKKPERKARAPKPKVYASADEARKAKTGNTQKVQKIKGGFILRSMSDAEMQAAAKAGQRARRSVGSVDETKDNLAKAMAKMGGINRQAATQDLGVHPDDFKTSSGVFGRPLFPATGGMDADSALEALTETGHLLPGSTLHDLEEKLGEQIRGDDVFSLSHDYGRPDPLADFTAPELDAADYTQIDPAAKAITEQLLAEAESLQIDTESIREDAARATEGQSDAAYQAAAQEALRQAIAQARGNAEERDATADRGRDQGRGEPAGDQGEAQGLTLEAQTAEDLRVKTDREQAALEAERKAKAAEQRALRQQDEGRDNRARADATVDDFELGKSADEQMSGMGDMFAEKPQAPKPQRTTTRVTPQVASRQQLASFIGIAADSVERLRASDVDRVIAETPTEYRVSVAAHIVERRPDLAEEVDSAMAEWQPTPSPQQRAEAAKTTAVADQVALRKRASVLQSLLDCLGS